MIYIIGEQHGERGARYDTSDHLAALMGISREELLGHVVWINLFETEGTDPRLTAMAVERAAQPGDAILLLGRRVANGWHLAGIPPLGSVVRGAGRGPRIVAVPHPSGRNRWWNDPDHRADAELALSSIWLRHSRET